jgi:glycosyltransferase involved in cell wall biosynthesis
MEENIFIVIPAYNEQENIQKTVKEWYEVVEKIGKGTHLVIIDDGSKDNTYKILTDIKNCFPQLIVITKQNSGHGATILYGYKYALENGADYIFQTDSDGQTSSDEFYIFWEQRKNFDVIIGNRTKRQDGISRIFVTKVLKLVLLCIFKVCISDANTPFRLMNAKILKKYIDKIPANFNLTNVLLSVYFVKYKEKLNFIPISFKKRQGGTNSINIKKIFLIAKQAVIDFRNIRKEMI